MATLITNEKLKKHSVDKYNFKVLSLGGHDEEQEVMKSFTSDENPNRRESDIDASAMSKSSKEALIESLMQKTDEMSSNFIKLQMKLEDKEQEYKKQLQETKEEAFNAGIEEGIKKVAEDKESDAANGLAQFSSSVATLEQSAKDFEKALEGIKDGLITAALDIAQEVVSAEVSQNSQDIAKVLGDGLIEELQGATKITLKVNPKDHGKISQHVGTMDHITVVSDGAVSEGGVIAISDVGNIDAQISKRFERVKRAALSE